MTSVLNHQQQLSGSKQKLKKYFSNTLLVSLLGALLVVSSCTPKVGVLRSPDVYNGNVGNEKSKDKETDKKVEEHIPAKKSFDVALLLPFQLDRVAGTSLSEEDVKRSALSLDFYQGFQMGMNESTKKSGQLALKVMDSEDNEMRVVSLASSKEVKEASIVVGPIYPKEIRSFGKSFSNGKVLQINPLAATQPSEFGLPNLVSITPSIKAHMRAIATDVVSKVRAGDAIIVYDSRDDDHRQFIDGFDQELTKLNPSAIIKHVSSASQLSDALSDLGTSYVISGTTEKNQLRDLVSNLEKNVQEGSVIRLYGHPLWNRFDFQPFSNFYRMNPTISSESNLHEWSSETQAFQRNYKKEFGVNPSDYSYKGYDAGRYFSTLLNKYGTNYSDKLENEGFNGLFSTYNFKYNSDWGYINEGVNLKVYRNGSFQ